MMLPFPPPVLEADGLLVRFDGFTALDGFSLNLPAGARHAVIGPNGAGKSTLINLLSGTLFPAAGSIRLAGQEITSLPAHQRVRRGLVRSFQINQLFPALSARESLMLAIAERQQLSGRWFRPLRRHAEIGDEATEMLERFGLMTDADRPAGALPYGRQRLLELALTLALKPKVLLLDEPAAGLSFAESRDLLAILETLPPQTAILLIEHDMDLVFRFARRISVLAAGRLLAIGPPEEIVRDPAVQAAYLGGYAHG
jgi:branched-chain amino acid transport system ATP-binding protein